MKLTHTGNNGLTRFGISMCTEGGIFFCQLGKGFRHLALTCLGLGFDRQLDNGLRELHGFENNRMLLVADGITCCSELQADSCGDVAGVDLGKFHSLIGMHLKDTAETLFLILRSIINVGTCCCRTAVNAEEGKLAYERICHDLECQSGEGLFIGRMSLDFVAVFIRTLNGRNVRGGRHIFDHSIDHLLDTLVPVCGSTGNRDCFTAAGSPSQDCLHLLCRRLFTLQIDLCKFVVQFTDLFNQFGTIQFGIIPAFCRNLTDGDVITLVIVIDIGLHLEQINNTLESIFCSNRDLDHNSVLAQSVADLVNAAEIICADNIHLVDECHTGDVICISLAPYIFGLRLNTAPCAEDAYSAVKHTKGTLDFNCEVYVAGSINDIDTVLGSTFLGPVVLVQSPVTCGSR